MGYREMKSWASCNAVPHMAPLRKQLLEAMRSFHDILDIGNFFWIPLAIETKMGWHFRDPSISVQKASYSSNI